MKADDINGLTSADVADRVAAGKVNRVVEPPRRRVGQIFRSNALTPVNAIMFVLFVLVLVSGNWRDGLFVGVVLSNTILGTAQELTARRELARLQILTEAKATVRRDGLSSVVDLDDLVIDDVVELGPGGQVPTDGEVITATGLQLDESMLTGESLPVGKSEGSGVLSGSFVVAGSGLYRTTAVGTEGYAGALTTEARLFTAAESQLRQSVNRILRWLTWLIPVASTLLLLSLLDSEPRWQDALLGTVAAAVAMVPDGLVLLTSLAFVAGVLELSRRNALAKQLSTVEVLARVDVLCLDKTGTITTGDIALEHIHPIGDMDEQDLRRALSEMAGADSAPNATMSAILEQVGTTSEWELSASEPFSSTRKWSAACFGPRGWFYLGAPDVLLTDTSGSSRLVRDLSGAGRRLVALARSEAGPSGDVAPAEVEGVAILEFVDCIRPDASDVLEYFAREDVTIKVISGDNHETVAAIAARAGVAEQAPSFDARNLSDDPSVLASQMEDNAIFGRVAPRQKQSMVRALQAHGHVVAMTGDGVNDVLALKDADLGIAMGSGSAAARAVADLVLIDNAFSTLPVVVAEGRKVINNVERVSNLFVTKAVYAVFLTALIGLIGIPFPFLPRQLTLIGTFSIGIPGFFLALAPETSHVRPGFLTRILRFSIPAGVVCGGFTFVAYETTRRSGDVTLAQARTLATVTLLLLGLVVLVVASRPYRLWKAGLAAGMGCGYVAVFYVPWLRDFFQLESITVDNWTVTVGCILAGGILIALIPPIVERLVRSEPDP